ncbi:hypothetical protein [Streptomyces sp. 3211]|nr:hypothetical protein [Streptomyces sp. 3211]
MLAITVLPSVLRHATVPVRFASVPAAGALRPLRDPDTPELDEDDDGEPV